MTSGYRKNIEVTVDPDVVDRSNAAPCIPNLHGDRPRRCFFSNDAVTICSVLSTDEAHCVQHDTRNAVVNPTLHSQHRASEAACSLFYAQCVVFVIRYIPRVGPGV